MRHLVWLSRLMPQFQSRPVLSVCVDLVVSKANLGMCQSPRVISWLAPLRMQNLMNDKPANHVCIFKLLGRVFAVKVKAPTELSSSRPFIRKVRGKETSTIVKISAQAPRSCSSGACNRTIVQEGCHRSLTCRFLVAYHSWPRCFGGGEGVGNVIHVASMPQSPKSLAFTAFWPLCHLCILRKDVKEDTLSKASMPLVTMSRAQYLQRFGLFVQHTVQGCGTRHVVTSVHVFGDHAQNMVFAAFCLLCTTYCTCARMWNKTLCHKPPCPWQPCPKHWYLQRFATEFSDLLKETMRLITVLFQGLGVCNFQVVLSVVFGSRVTSSNPPNM